MANDIVLKRSAVQNKEPTTSDLALGEIAVNTYDGKAFMKTNKDGTEAVVQIGEFVDDIVCKTFRCTADDEDPAHFESGIDVPQDVNISTVADNLTKEGFIIGGNGLAFFYYDRDGNDTADECVWINNVAGGIRMGTAAGQVNDPKVNISTSGTAAFDGQVSVGPNAEATISATGVGTFSSISTAGSLSAASMTVTGNVDFDSNVTIDGLATFEGAFLGKEGFQFRTTTNDLEPTQGAGLEFWYQQSSARYVLQTYDRGSGSLQPLQLASSNWSLYSGGDADFNGTVEVGKSSASETHAYGIIAKSSVTADSAQSSTIYARNLASGGRLWYGAAYDSASTNTSYILENGTAYFANFTDGSTTVSAANVVNTKAALTAIKAACNDASITTVAGLKTAIADALANF